MTGMNSRSVITTQVYAQDTQPTDERDGVMWVDTSVSPRDTYVYSSDSASWEGIAPAETLSASDGAGYVTAKSDVTVAAGDLDWTAIDGIDYWADGFKADISINSSASNTVDLLLRSADDNNWWSIGDLNSSGSGVYEFSISEQKWDGIQIENSTSYDATFSYMDFNSKSNPPHIHLL